MSIPSHKSSAKKTRAVQAPQRSNGKLRVAAILEAAATVIDERGYEAATMAEIADRSGTKIGSLYRFFPNKESLADTIVVNALENLDTAFDKLDAGVSGRSIRALTDHLMTLIFDLFTRPAVVKLLDTDRDWSVKREEFRSAFLQRIAKTLMIHTANLSKKLAEDIAEVVLLNVKTVAKHQAYFGSASSIADEFRDMTRLYLQSKLSSSGSKKRLPS